MKKGEKLWTEEELILGINLYSKLPFGQLHKGNPSIMELASIIGRTSGAVALKLGNFASIDPKQKERGIKGMSNAGSLTEKIWNEFYNDWDANFYKSEQLLADKKGTTIASLNDIKIDDLPTEGKEKERLVKVRVNQSLFRTLVSSNYNNKCCITGISNPELLVASHISLWSKDEKNRLNPANGLFLNALHDKAFESGLITITEELKLKVSSILLKQSNIKSIKQNFLDLNGQSILLPKKFKPDVSFLQAHHERFKH